MDYLVTFIALLTIAGNLGYLWTHWQRWKSYVRQQTPVHYQPVGGRDPWRWGDPPTGLALIKRDDEGSSRITLPNEASEINTFGTLAGVAAILLGLWLLIDKIFLEPETYLLPLQVVMSFLIIFAGRQLTFLDSRLVAIELRPDRVVLLQHYGIRLVRPIVFRRRRVKYFSGKVQGAMGMARGQVEPNYYIFVKRRFSIRALMFVTGCGIQQGTWLVEGLQYWLNGQAGLNS
jgi:hypothetical protein